LVDARGASVGRLGGRGGGKFAGEGEAVDGGMSLAEGVEKGGLGGGKDGETVVIKPASEDVMEGQVGLVGCVGGAGEGGVRPVVFVEVAKDDRCKVESDSISVLLGEGIGKGGGSLSVEGGVGEAVDGDDPQYGAGWSAEGHCDEPTGWVTIGVGVGYAGIPDQGGARGLLVGRVEGPES
jgi:hypothetical protein